MTRKILHLDMDSFFASVEQQANPKLRGKPVGIIKGERRTCIIASSREAKRLGIKTGTTTYEAKRICPRLILVPADFDKYFFVSQKFIEICSRFSPELEVFSIDELFLEISQTKKFFAGTSGIVRKIKQALKQEIGEYITCSIGISYNRLLAKLASGKNKPDGVFEITPENKNQVLFASRLSDVCGLGFRLERRLFNLGITNFKSLRALPIEYLQASFGPFWARELKKLSYGEDDSLLARISEIPQAKSVSRTFTLYENTRNLRKIKATLRNLSEEAAFKAREMGMAGRLVGVSVRGNNLGDYKCKTLKHYPESGKEVFDIAWQLYQEMKWTDPVRFLGVWLSLLQPKRGLSLSWLPEEKRKENLTLAMDKINKRFGELTVYPAVLLQGELIKSEVNGFLGDKAYRFGGKI